MVLVQVVRTPQLPLPPPLLPAMTQMTEQPPRPGSYRGNILGWVSPKALRDEVVASKHRGDSAKTMQYPQDVVEVVIKERWTSVQQQSGILHTL